jgi:hypothetical protein
MYFNSMFVVGILVKYNTNPGGFVVLAERGSSRVCEEVLTSHEHKIEYNIIICI